MGHPLAEVDEFADGADGSRMGGRRRRYHYGGSSMVRPRDSLFRCLDTFRQQLSGFRGSLPHDAMKPLHWLIRLRL